MIDWDQWQTLLSVFRFGTYARAARAMNVDATTVGRRIKLLEKHCGYTLFFRQEGRLYPTNQCEALLSHLENASEAIRAAEQESAGSQSGAIWRKLRITAPPFIVNNLLAPAVADIANGARIQVELMARTSNISLSRREADISIRIDDKQPVLKKETEQIDAQRIGSLAYAVYAKLGAESDSLPWAGLMEDHVRTSGSTVMAELAGELGFQYRVHYFDALLQMVQAGAARAMLPCFMGDQVSSLRQVGEQVLSQPLWMLYHQQDNDVHHLIESRNWIRSLFKETFTKA